MSHSATNFGDRVRFVFAVLQTRRLTQAHSCGIAAVFLFYAFLRQGGVNKKCGTNFERMKKMSQMRKRLLSLLLSGMMLLGIAPLSVFAQSENSNTAAWTGAMNFNDANNYVTTVKSMTASNMTEMKWAYPLNDTVISGGAYYAGQSVIIDGYLYATGGGKLHKVDIETGIGTVINEAVGSTVSYYDYLCYADGILILSTQDSLAAYNTEGECLGTVSGTYGYYHPVQYHNGYVICNGFIYKLEKESDAVSFTQAGTAAIGGDAFNWSSGAFVNDLFYVASKTTVYAVDYKTNTIIDSYIFDASRTATQNVQAGLCYDEETGRLFWGTYSYNSHIHSIAIDKSEGETKGCFDESSYISEDAKQKSVATPIVYDGRVYLAGQQGRICVLNANDLSAVYDYVTLGGGKVQGNPILSAADEEIRIYAQCADGHLYMFTDNGDSGSAVKLAETENYTKVLYPYAGYEQYAMDNSGNIYCYNESGYLFCFGVSECEVPVITTDLSADRVKYALGAKTEPLAVEASVSEGAGELSYQWQSSTDKEEWSDIDGAQENNYTPSAEEEMGTYYRCIITNTKDGYTASTSSAEAYILVKKLSKSTALNIMAGSTNSITGGTRTEAELGEDGIYYINNRQAKVTNIWLGVEDEGTVTKLDVIYGSGGAEPKKYNVSSNDKFAVRYYKNSYSLPIVAKVTAVAEDTVTESEQYIIVSSGGEGSYITKASITSESEFFAENTKISFSEKGQTAKLAIIPKETVGTGDLYSPQWVWTSSDVKVATVDEEGNVKSIGGGEATITAAYETITASVKVSSAAPVHKTHTYAEGACTECTTKEPAAVSSYFTMIDKNNEAAVSKDAATKIYETEFLVGDIDCDGAVTLNDAFIKLHTDHSSGGSSDFVTEESSYGLYITKLWGEEGSNVSYTVNNAFASSLTTPLNEDDKIKAYFYTDTLNYSDVYIYTEGKDTIAVNNETVYTVNGLTSSGAVIPKGATVRVYGAGGEEVPSMLTTVGDDGKFTLNFEKEGAYSVKISGTASYTGKVWDSGSNSYKDEEFNAAPVVLSQIDVSVLPYVEKTVYVTISTKSGEFAVNKNGEEMWRFPVTASDNAEAPDGKVTILEVLTEAHRQYHPDAEAGFTAAASSYGAYITKLWGENNGGNCLYYFNDAEMTGSGTKNGSNEREWEDKLLDTVVEDEDAFSIYSLQATDYRKADLYTYFYPVSEAAIVGKEKTFTVKSIPGYGDNKLETSLVKVYDSANNELKDLETQVGADGTFEITFEETGTYTVDVRTNGANYISPSRCIVHVNRGSSNNTSSAENYVYISVKDPNGKTYLKKTSYTMGENETAYSLLKKTGLEVKSTTEYQYSGVYIESIEGLGEFDEGSTSGWMYKVNGEFPDYSSSLYALSDGDYVEWIYTRELGSDVGDNSYSGSSSKKVKKEENTEENSASEQTSTSCPFGDVSEHWAYDAVKYVYDRNIMQGTSETTFAPDKNMTRAMLVTVLHRLEKEEATNSDNKFADVPASQWYTNAVLWAASNGIVNGISENQFAPDADISREEMATIIYRYAKMKGYEVNEFANLSQYTDANEVNSWALDAVKWANAQGIINGTEKTTLSPKDTATRAQVATILMRFCENSAK